ncbi:Major facilitator superfamily domain, general substrate transporter [Metarhizium rileyi]|uniref:Major facilitator superfamily domain, general substrate transporter n=1 Tax=Metarhizium rileyi (strain RCEF 4871) TaxID=1649241 RepID=A0A166YGA3_METRR|nr:Major facilitator superfamily domain, general substrate transporter [Metarhizium rileyi RCEF 4871]
MAAVSEPSISSSDDHQRVKEFPPNSSRNRSHFFHTRLDDDVCNQKYSGKGTADDPYVIDYLPDDRQDPLNMSMQRKWVITFLQAMSALVVTFASSVYASGIEDVKRHFDVSEEVSILGLSLFVLGFALGPLIWGPMSELYGRRPVYVISFMAFTAFSVAAPVSPNIQSLLVFRFLSCAFGSSSMTNGGGVITDMLTKEQRGAAMGAFVTAPFLGPALGPIAGGFLVETQGWRWTLGLIAIMAGVVWIATSLATPETYAPYILRSRARALSKMTGSVYVSRLDAGQPPKTLTQELLIALSRPWVLLFREPIVLLMSLYMSIVYGTLYMFFAAIPIVFQGTRGWNTGAAGLPFVGVTIGVCLATVLSGVDNKRYVRLCETRAAKGDTVEPEARLGATMVSSIVLPVGLFLFAWTTYPSVHWIAPIIGALLFSCGLVLVFISQLSYLIDCYTVYSASVLAAGSMLRSLFGTAFPLFTTQMYENLGDQWASSIPAFLALACVPIPFLFYKYGPMIRSKCKFASEAARMLELMQRGQDAAVGDEPKKKVGETV